MAEKKQASFYIWWSLIFALFGFLEFMARKVRDHAGDQLWPRNKPRELGGTRGSD